MMKNKKHNSRRQFIKTSAVVTAGVLMPGVIRAEPKQVNTVLPIPPILSGERKGTIIKYQLKVQSGLMQFQPGQMTPTLGYNGNYLGPTIRLNKGDEVDIEVTNSLNEDTTVHWHGMILPAKMDGGPHQNILPGNSWHSKYRVTQPAATLFYHSHAHGNTGQQVYRGLAGIMIIDDDESAQSGLPDDYGIDDIPVIIQDRDFSSDGQFSYINFMPERMIGKHGKTILVNGAVSPVLKAQKTFLRLRLLNASNARFYNLTFSDDRSFKVIATDGGLLEQPVTLNRLEMAPAERFEILLDVSDGNPVMLQSIGGVGNASHGPMGMMGMDRSFDILLIDPQKAEKSKARIRQQLTVFPDWSQQPIASKREFDLQMGMGMMMGGGSGGMMGINGNGFSMNRIDFIAKKDSFEIWVLNNSSPMSHPFHVHNTQFRIISRNGQTPLVFERGFKDTVVVNSGDEVRILVPIGPYTDKTQPYMYHCHILEHEDGGMMGQFTVV